MHMAVQQLSALHVGVLKHACDCQQHAQASAAACANTRSQAALAVSHSTISAAKAFPVLRSQTNMHTADVVGSAFAAIAASARAEAEAKRDAIRAANNAVNVHCLSAAVV
jgi:hypothetical protein